MFRIWIYDTTTGKEFCKTFDDYEKYRKFKIRVEHSKKLIITLTIEEDL